MRPQTFSFSGHYFKEFELEFLIWGSSLRDDFVIGSTRQDVKKTKTKKKQQKKKNSSNQKANLSETPVIKQTVQSLVLSLFLRIYGENYHSYSPLTFAQQSQLLGTNLKIRKPEVITLLLTN